MNTKHTPSLPLRRHTWHDSNIDDANGLRVASAESTFDADYIVRACNGYADAIEALDELVAEFDARNAERDAARDGVFPDTGGIAFARTILARIGELMP